MERFVTATIVLDSALHIGVGKDQKPTDAPVRRTGDGRLLIPGRAIGGSLRTLATRLAPRMGLAGCAALQAAPDRERPCGCPVCRLFGDVHPVDATTILPDGSVVQSHASRLWVYDAFASESQPTYVRDGVGINRARGSAVPQVKYTYETVPTETQFRMKLRWTTTDAITDELLVATLAEWQAGRGQLGGNVARGMGRFHLRNLDYSQTTIQTAADLVDYLAAEKPADVAQSLAEWVATRLQTAQQRVRPIANRAGMRAQGVAGSFVKIDFTLAFKDFFLIDDPLMGMLSGKDHAPLVSWVGSPGQSGKPVLSGSGLRGALRSHGEKIARTLATHHWVTTTAADAGARFLEHGPACHVLAREEKDALASCDTRLEDVVSNTSETPEAALCPSCRLFGSQRRGSRLWVRDAVFAESELTADNWKVQDFLAIDRFTGGGVDSVKFDAAPLLRARFEGQLVLHDPEPWELGWLTLLVRDLAEGLLTVGFGAAKGYGRCQATGIVWQVGYLHGDDVANADFGLFSQMPEDSELSGLYQLVEEDGGNDGLPDVWRDDANHWVGAFNQMVTAPTTDDNWQLFRADTLFSDYFNEDEELVTGNNNWLRQYGLPRPEVE